MFNEFMVLTNLRRVDWAPLLWSQSWRMPAKSKTGLICPSNVVYKIFFEVWPCSIFHCKNHVYALPNDCLVELSWVHRKKKLQESHVHIMPVSLYTIVKNKDDDKKSCIMACTVFNWLLLFVHPLSSISTPRMPNLCQSACIHAKFTSKAQKMHKLSSPKELKMNINFIRALKLWFNNFTTDKVVHWNEKRHSNVFSFKNSNNFLLASMNRVHNFTYSSTWWENDAVTLSTNLP